MKREIKFRAFWSTVNEMRYFEPHHFVDSPAGWLMTFKLSENQNDNIYIGKAEIMQYTGLKDINGKDVYEGDLLKMYRHNDIVHKHIEATVWKDGKYIPDIKEVKFINGSFVVWSDLIQDYRCFAHLARPGESFEIIGNIYENAELLTHQT